MAGLPIYLHAPKYYADHHGIALGTLGVVLGLLRIIDVVQDPLLGWLAQSRHRAALVAGGFGVMVTSMLGLFAVAPPFAATLWFALCLTGLFSAFSLLTICLYAQGVGAAADLGVAGHTRLAGWREGGALLGICLGAALPSLLATTAHPMAGFAVGFALVALAAYLAALPLWSVPVPIKGPRFAPVLANRGVRRLLVLAFVNGAPVAVTSTLFLFYVESGLGLPGWEGGFLILFFLSAALSTPLWSRLAARFDPRKVLAAAMAMAIASFVLTLNLNPGAAMGFGLICVASGAALGADMTLLPALFARNIAGINGAEAMGFGLYSFASKLSLAMAALMVLPALQWLGFDGPDSPKPAIDAMILLYAGLPCALKLISLAVLATIPEPDPAQH